MRRQYARFSFTKGALALFVVCLAASLSPAAEAGGEQVAPPVGVFVCCGPSPTPEREVNLPFVDGWLVRPRWDTVELREGQYDWTYIDNEIVLAKRLAKDSPRRGKSSLRASSRWLSSTSSTSLWTSAWLRPRPSGSCWRSKVTANTWS